MRCENNCGKDHDGKYGSGRFCSAKCARSFSTKSKRKEINKKVSQSLKGYKTIPGGKIKLCDYGCGQEAKYQLNNKKWCCEDSCNKCPIIRNKNSKGLKTAHQNDKISGFPKNAYIKGHEVFRKNLQEKYKLLSFEEKPNAEQRRIVLSEQDNKCIICGINKWMDKPLTLHLDHIDGNRKNNKRENIRFICPNCHSQTSTYCRGNKIEILELDLKNELIKTNCNISKALMNLNRIAGGSNWCKAKTIISKYNLNG